MVHRSTSVLAAPRGQFSHMTCLLPPGDAGTCLAQRAIMGTPGVRTSQGRLCTSRTLTAALTCTRMLCPKRSPHKRCAPRRPRLAARLLPCTSRTKRSPQYPCRARWSHASRTRAFSQACTCMSRPEILPPLPLLVNRTTTILGRRTTPPAQSSRSCHTTSPSRRTR